MKAATAFSLLLSLATTLAIPAPYVDTTYPYTGPAVPVADPVNPTLTYNGTGLPRLTEPPAVHPTLGSNPTNNINVISMSYIPGGMNIHFQTPFGLDGEACVNWGTDPKNLGTNTKGMTKSYDRTPPCSMMPVTQCSQFFHDVHLPNLQPGTTYYYQIPGGNGTTPSSVMSFQTAQAAGDSTSFSVAVINDMGYTNAKGTHLQLMAAAESGTAFAWHGGDISYADDWYEALLPCNLNASDPNSWPVCYNGSDSSLPGGVDNPDYLIPLPAGEMPSQGGPNGGDFSVAYEPNWDLWQQWMNTITTQMPYMVNPGNHEATCAEFDGDNGELTALLVDNENPGSTAITNLTYYSCPESQRNFTAYQHRFTMNGNLTGGVSNFWYSFNYGLAHFISFSGETDYYQSPEYPFVADLKGNETHPTEEETYITDSGPFGYINGSYKVNENYEQWQWMKKDLESVDRTKTPWVFAMSHRPMYSSQVSSYQTHMRNAWEQLFLDNGVDAYMAGHIHWYERMYPMGFNGTIDSASIVDDHTYKTNNGKSMLHIVNGQAGNIESHSQLDGDPVLNITAHLDYKHYGFTKLTVYNASVASWEFVQGSDGSTGDYVYLMKE